MNVTHLHGQSSCNVAHFDADGRPIPCPDPIRPPDTDEDACTDPAARPDFDRANRERARDLALTCFALLAILAIVLWWTQR